MEERANEAGVPNAAPERPHVAIVGSGVIGRSWIRVFTRAGHPVRVWDQNPAAVASALDWHAAECLRDGGPSARVTGDDAMSQAVHGAAWVQESGPEALEVKRALFAALDAAAPPEAIIASSTSTLDMTEIARDLPGAHRCIVAHPVNPPHVIPAVEVLGGMATSDVTRARTVEMLRSVGQVPVPLRRMFRASS